MEVSENLSGISKPYKGSSREFHKISFSEPTIQNDPKWQWKKCKSRTVHWASCREFMLISTTQNLCQNKNYPIQSPSWQIWRKMSTFSASCRSLLFQAERLWPRISPLETWRIMPAEGQGSPLRPWGYPAIHGSMGTWREAKSALATPSPPQHGSRSGDMPRQAPNFLVCKKNSIFMWRVFMIISAMDRHKRKENEKVHDLHNCR